MSIHGKTIDIKKVDKQLNVVYAVWASEQGGFGGLQPPLAK